MSLISNFTLSHSYKIKVNIAEVCSLNETMFGMFLPFLEIKAANLLVLANLHIKDKAGSC